MFVFPGTNTETHSLPTAASSLTESEATQDKSKIRACWLNRKRAFCINQGSLKLFKGMSN